MSAQPQQDPKLATLARWDRLVKFMASEMRYTDPETGEVYVGAKAITAAEMALRKEAFGLFFPEPKEGANTVVLPGSWRLVATNKIDRKVDPGALDALRTARVKDHADTLRAFGIDVATLDPEALVTAAMRVNLDHLLEFKPEVKTKPFRELTEEQRAVFELCLITKPASPALEIKEPIAPKAAAPLSVSGS